MSLFSAFSKSARLERKYKKLMNEYHRLSAIDRAASDAKYSEAQEVERQLLELENNQ